MEQNKHFKLYKAGKRWLVAAIATTSAVIFLGVANDAHADTAVQTNPNTTTSVTSGSAQPNTVVTSGATSSNATTNSNETNVSAPASSATNSNSVISQPTAQASASSNSTVANPTVVTNTNDTTTQADAPTSITLSKTTDYLTTGTTHQLYASTDPDQIINSDITWSSSDDSIATVDTDGLVTTLATGTAVITAATSNGLNATDTVNVVGDAVSLGGYGYTSIPTIVVGGSYQIGIAQAPSDATNISYKFSSSDPSIVKVNEAGVITGVSAGDATVTFSIYQNNSSYPSATVDVPTKVNNVDATGITLNETTVSLPVNETSQLVATVTPTGTTDKTVTWSSSDPSVATVDVNGLVTGVADGVAVITATTVNGLTAKVTVVVPELIPLVNVNYYAPTSLKVGQTYQSWYALVPGNANYCTTTWTSSDPTVATIDHNGLVTALKEGTTVITILTSQVGGGTMGGQTTLTVSPGIAISDISFDTSSSEVPVGETTKLNVNTQPDDATITKLTWSSSDASVATVDQDGNVTGLKTGSTTITVTTEGGLSATLTLLVEVPVPVNSFSYTADSYDLKAGSTEQLISVIDPSLAVFPTIVWTTSNQYVASVDADGLVTAQAPGTTTITGTLTDTFGNVKLYSHDFTAELADPSLLPSAATVDGTTAVLTSAAIQQLMTNAGLNYSDLVPFNGLRFASSTIYYQVLDDPTLVDSTGQTISMQDLVEQSIAIWQKALTAVGSNIQFLPADADHAAMLDFNQTDNEKNPGTTGDFTTDQWEDSQIIITPANVWVNTEALDNIYPVDSMIETVLHEIGHALGLDHTSDKSDFMWPVVSDNTTVSLKDAISVLLNYSLTPGTSSSAALGFGNYEL